MIREIFSRPVLIFGCGNVLMGDDGFGPAVIEYLEQNFQLPESVLAVDAGTSIRGLLFDLLLAPAKPGSIFIVDAVSQPCRVPGELFELLISQLPEQKVNDFSLHQFPSVNLLDELRESAGVDVRVLAVQTKEIPDEVKPGISAELKETVPAACQRLMEWIEGLS